MAAGQPRAGDYPMASDAQMRGRTIPPGGPIKQSAQGYENPGATPNMRGVEENTGHSNGTPFELPPMLTPGRHGELDGNDAGAISMDEAANTYAADVPAPKSEPRASDFPVLPTRDWGTSEAYEGGTGV